MKKQLLREYKLRSGGETCFGRVRLEKVDRRRAEGGTYLNRGRKVLHAQRKKGRKEVSYAGWRKTGLKKNTREVVGESTCSTRKERSTQFPDVQGSVEGDYSCSEIRGERTWVRAVRWSKKKLGPGGERTGHRSRLLKKGNGIFADEKERSMSQR